MEKAEDQARHSTDEWQTLAVPCQVDQLGVKYGLEAAPPRYEGGILGSVQADRKTLKRKYMMANVQGHS